MQAYVVTPFITPKDSNVAQIAVIARTYANKYYYLTVQPRITGMYVEVVAHIRSRHAAGMLASSINQHTFPNISVCIYHYTKQLVCDDIIRVHSCKYQPTHLLPGLQN